MKYDYSPETADKAITANEHIQAIINETEKVIIGTGDPSLPKPTD